MLFSGKKSIKIVLTNGFVNKSDLIMHPFLLIGVLELFFKKFIFAPGTLPKVVFGVGKQLIGANRYQIVLTDLKTIRYLKIWKKLTYVGVGEMFLSDDLILVCVPVNAHQLIKLCRETHFL